jgi:hypothetical protein
MSQAVSAAMNATANATAIASRVAPAMVREVAAARAALRAAVGRVAAGAPGNDDDGGVGGGGGDDDDDDPALAQRLCETALDLSDALGTAHRAFETSAFALETGCVDVLAAAIAKWRIMSPNALCAALGAVARIFVGLTVKRLPAPRVDMRDRGRSGGRRGSALGGAAAQPGSPSRHGSAMSRQDSVHSLMSSSPRRRAGSSFMPGDIDGSSANHNNSNVHHSVHNSSGGGGNKGHFGNTSNHDGCDPAAAASKMGTASNSDAASTTMTFLHDDHHHHHHHHHDHHEDGIPWTELAEAAGHTAIQLAAVIAGFSAEIAAEAQAQRFAANGTAVRILASALACILGSATVPGVAGEMAAPSTGLVDALASATHALSLLTAPHVTLESGLTAASDAIFRLACDAISALCAGPARRRSTAELVARVRAGSRLAVTRSASRQGSAAELPGSARRDSHRGERLLDVSTSSSSGGSSSCSSMGSSGGGDNNNNNNNNNNNINNGNGNRDVSGSNDDPGDARDNDLRARLVETTVVEDTMARLRFRSAEPVAAHLEALRLLFHLSSHAPNLARLAELDLLRVVQPVVHEHLDAHPLLNAALALLANLCTDHVTSDLAGNERCHSLVMWAMKHHPHAQDTQRLGALVLASIARHAHHRDHMGREHGMELLLQTMRAHRSAGEELLAALALALSAAVHCHAKNAHKLLGAGGIETLLLALRTHSSSLTGGGGTAAADVSLAAGMGLDRNSIDNSIINNSNNNNNNSTANSHTAHGGDGARNSAQRRQHLGDPQSLHSLALRCLATLTMHTRGVELLITNIGVRVVLDTLENIQGSDGYAADDHTSRARAQSSPSSHHRHHHQTRSGSRAAGSRSRQRKSTADAPQRSSHARRRRRRQANAAGPSAANVAIASAGLHVLANVMAVCAESRSGAGAKDDEQGGQGTADSKNSLRRSGTATDYDEGSPMQVSLDAQEMGRVLRTVLDCGLLYESHAAAQAQVMRCLCNYTSGAGSKSHAAGVSEAVAGGAVQAAVTALSRAWDSDEKVVMFALLALQNIAHGNVTVVEGR